MSAIKKRIAFYGDKKFKKQLLAEVEEHRKQDRFVKGSYGIEGLKGFRGCAVGCSIRSLNRLRKLHIPYNDHDGMAEAIGVPTVLIGLQDKIFEMLPHPLYAEWSEKFFSAIQPGADLAMVWPKFAHWMLVDPDVGVIRFAKTDKTKQAIEDVAGLFLRQINGDKPIETEWRKAARAAAARSAAAAYHAATAYACAADSDDDAVAAYIAYANRSAAYAYHAASVNAAGLSVDDSANAATTAAYTSAAYTSGDYASECYAASASYTAAANVAVAASCNKFCIAASEKLVQLMAEAPVLTGTIGGRA